MIGFILTCIVFIGLSMLLAMIPPFIFCILLEMKGLGSYVYALIIIVASIVELIKFIFYIFCESNIKLNPKDLFKNSQAVMNEPGK